MILEILYILARLVVLWKSIFERGQGSVFLTRIIRSFLELKVEGQRYSKSK